MLDKIQFQNGTIVTREYLNETQKGSSFSADTQRDNYFSEPTEAEHSSWAIGQRDKLKDWEIADPREDNETAVGRLAHDGVVLNSYDPTTGIKVWGPPALSETSVGSGIYGTWVEAGSIILSDGSIASWGIQFVQLISGSEINYIYLDESVAKTAIEANTSISLSIGSSLPSVSVPHIPIAKLTLNADGTGLATNEDGDVSGVGYVDLRSNVYIGNLNTYPKILKNTDFVSTSKQVSAWERVIADTSGGSIVITLPNAPTDSDRIAIVDISGTFDRYPIIIRPGENTSINNSVDDWIVNIKDAHLELFFHEATNTWRFEESPGGECTPVLGTFLSCGGREFIGQRLPEECPDNQVVPSTYPNPSEAVYRYEGTTSKCYKEYYENVAVYANGQGGLIRVQNAPRCNKENFSLEAKVRNIIYVDPSIGDDSVQNTGFSEDTPFRTLERALIEGVRESRRAGQNNDRYDRVVIELAPGDYYVDNSPGSGGTPSLTEETGLIQRVDTGLTIGNVIESDRFIEIAIDTSNPSFSQPPTALNLGRILYSQSGGVGNIAKIEKQSLSSSVWKVTLEYVRGTFANNDALFYDNLSIINPSSGGLVVPRGISIDGVDLRKVRIRPMYVPELEPIQDEPQRQRTSIFKVTGGSYISLLTFTDNPQYARSHNTVTSVSFASENEIRGGQSESSYYSKINSLFSIYDGWEGDGLEPIGAETTIVAPIYGTKDQRQTDLEQNQTGLLSPDSDITGPISYPGATRLTRLGDSSPVPYDLPDINSTRSSSPYVFNCSVRSIFGLNGLHADGGRVSGFKSMVTANFTQVSLQTDPTCFNDESYYLDPPTNKQDGVGKQYRTCSSDPLKYRHFGFKGSNDATIQIVSCFVIGNADHFIAESGSDLSITNSCSDFGDVSLRSVGYKPKPFSQDIGTPTTAYGGTRILEIIPPLPLSYEPLASTGKPTLVDTEINTGLVLDYELTKDWILANKVGELAPTQMRIYFRSANASSPFTATSNPPSAAKMGFGQFSYTRKTSSGSYELVGGSRENRKRIAIKGFDELGNSIIYTGNIVLARASDPGFEYLDDKSKIFVWDGTESCWYVNVSTDNVLEESQDEDGDGFLIKKFNYAFRYKLKNDPTGSDLYYSSLDFLFPRASLTTTRGIDRRTSEQRIYKVVLDGFSKARGIRRPQNFYVLEKQAGVAGYPLNNSVALSTNPLTISQVRTYDEVFYPNSPIVQYPDRYVTYLTFASDARKVPTGDVYPSVDNDQPELTADPTDSITRRSLVEFLGRPGVYFSASIEPSERPITIKTGVDENIPGILIGLRRPSVIRASGHTWEWTGYLNYDTSFPTFQGDPLEQDFALGKIIVESNGGKVYATGMNEEGSFYIGTTVFDLRTGEQFAIPLEADNEPGSVTNQVFNSVVIRSVLAMADGTSTFFGTDSAIYLDPTTTINTTTGPISASQNPLPESYATTSKAGFVQLAEDAVIRGALGQGGKGISERVAVSAAALARELNIRIDNSLSAGRGVSISQNYIELPGGNPNDPTDDVLSSVFSIGLPGNTDSVSFSALRLGSDEGGIEVNTISSSITKTNARDSALVTERAIRDYVIDTDQLQAASVTEAILASESVTSTKISAGAVTTEKIGNQAITFDKLANSSVGSTKLADLAVTTEKIANNAITADKISNSVIGFNKLATGLYRTSSLGIRDINQAVDNVFATERAIRSALDSLLGTIESLIPEPTVVEAGNGLTATGTSTNITVSLGVPGSITSNSGNNATATSHTHQLENNSVTIDKISFASAVVTGTGADLIAVNPDNASATALVTEKAVSAHVQRRLVHVLEQVGSYGLFIRVNPQLTPQNTQVAASELRYSSANAATGAEPETGGTWVCKGYLQGGDPNEGAVTVWHRIA
jgi:hypothetical protein